MGEVDFGELLEETWQSFKSRFKVFFSLAFLLYYIPTIALSIFSVLYLLPRFLSEVASTLESLKNILLMFIINIPVALLQLLFIVSVIYALIRIPQNKTSFKKAIKGGASFYWKMLLLNLLLGIALMFLSLLLIVPGIIFAVYWSFSIYVIVNDNCSVTESLRRSKNLVESRWWKVFGYSLLMGLIIGLISFFVQLATSSLLSSLWNNLIYITIDSRVTKQNIHKIYITMH